jgi:hypothetical protein
MRSGPPQVSGIERVASLAVASGVTVGIALLVLGALAPTLVRRTAGTSGLDGRRLSEQLVFVSPTIVPAPAAAVVPPRQARRSAPQAAARATDATTAREPAPARDTMSVRPPVATPTAVGPSSAPPASAGAPVASAVVGFTRTSQPIRFDSVLRTMSDSIAIGLASGVLKPPPLTQAEKDAKWRDEAFEVAAARASGAPLRRTMAGGSIPVPLPFGGPSRKQRERDRAIEAELKPIRALRQQKVDSIVAARERRRADSLAHLPDSLRPAARPQP